MKVKERKRWLDTYPVHSLLTMDKLWLDCRYLMYILVCLYTQLCYVPNTYIPSLFLSMDLSRFADVSTIFELTNTGVSQKNIFFFLARFDHANIHKQIYSRLHVGPIRLWCFYRVSKRYLVHLVEPTLYTRLVQYQLHQ